MIFEFFFKKTWEHYYSHIQTAKNNYGQYQKNDAHQARLLSIWCEALNHAFDYLLTNQTSMDKKVLNTRRHAITKETEKYNEARSKTQMADSSPIIWSDFKLDIHYSGTSQTVSFPF